MVRKGAIVTKPGIVKAKGVKQQRKITYKYFIDAAVPVVDGIFDLDNFVRIIRTSHLCFFRLKKASSHTFDLCLGKVHFGKVQGRWKDRKLDRQGFCFQEEQQALC